MDKSPELQQSLAYHVLSNRRAWLGRASLKSFELVLAGAAMRARLTSCEIPYWRIYGPLDAPDFYLPLVARTGHPTLSIKWSLALELTYFDLEEASVELLRLMQEWRSPLDTRPVVSFESRQAFSSYDFVSFLGDLAKRPGMFLGSNDGWDLRCYLHGMADGGDWLALPELKPLREAMRRIEERSSESYGSDFAAYRVYDAQSLLKWATGTGPVGEAPGARAITP